MSLFVVARILLQYTGDKSPVLNGDIHHETGVINSTTYYSSDIISIYSNYTQNGFNNYYCITNSAVCDFSLELSCEEFSKKYEFEYLPESAIFILRYPITYSDIYIFMDYKDSNNYELELYDNYKLGNNNFIKNKDNCITLVYKDGCVIKSYKNKCYLNSDYDDIYYVTKKIKEVYMDDQG